MAKKVYEENNCFLFPADFETFNFEQLLQENNSKDYEGILWSNCCKNSFCRNVKIKKGDIVYVYYTHLPDNINRILLELEVIDAYEKGINEDCFYYENDKEKKEMIKNPNKRKPGIRLKLKDGKGILPYELESDKLKFSEESLLKKYSFKNFQGKQYLTGKHENLLHDLENETRRYTLKQLTTYMNNFSQCALKDYFPGNHTTFVKENGLNYYEQHHLIQQYNARKNKKLQKIIDDKMNLINLCPNCHRQIHNGKKEDREKMVRKLYTILNKKNKDFDKLLDNIRAVEKGKEIDWLLQQYINHKNQDKDI